MGERGHFHAHQCVNNTKVPLNNYLSFSQYPIQDWWRQYCSVIELKPAHLIEFLCLQTILLHERPRLGKIHAVPARLSDWNSILWATTRQYQIFLSRVPCLLYEYSARTGLCCSSVFDGGAKKENCPNSALSAAPATTKLTGVLLVGSM